MFKKYLIALLSATMMFSLVACGSKSDSSNSSTKDDSEVMAEAVTEEPTEDATTPETVTVKALDGSSAEVEVTVPYNPERIVVLDLAALDIIDSLGLGDRIVGLANSSNVDYLKGYMSKENVVNVGTVKEVDFEAIMACEPDAIFMGGRMGENYDALTEIAPVIRLTSDSTIGVVESTKLNATKIASVFGKESEVDALFSGFDTRIEALKEVAEGKTAVVGMTTNGGFNIVGNGGRCSIIGVEVGFNNLGNEYATESEKGGSDSASSEKAQGSKENAKSEEKSNERSGSTHGNEASFELVVSLKPDYIFVMDRDAAIATEGAKLAKEIMENELIMSTDAYKSGNLVVLEHPSVWYVAEGGINALNIMISDLESVLLQ